MDLYLGPYELTQAGNPLLLDDEVTLQNESSLSLYFGDTKKYKNYACILTTCRILLHNSNKTRYSLHLKHIQSLRTKSGMGFSSPKIILQLNDREVVERVRNTNNNSSEQKWSNLQKPILRKIPPPLPGYMMLSFHNGSSNRDSFMVKLNKAMQKKTWVKKVAEKRVFSIKSAGIRGLVQEQKERQAKAKTMVNDAFEDLESLMNHAKEMVLLANRLAASQEVKDSANEFDSMLHNMGIASPVTKEAAGNQFHQLLARQLVDFLLKPLSKAGGILTLTDIYCMYNRARGSQLIAPDDLLQACKIMQHMNMPMYLRRFDTGVLVLQLTQYNDQNTYQTILNLIAKYNSLNELRFSQLVNISINLARQQLLSAEKNGHVCRDDSIEGLSFFRNIFVNYDQKRLQLDRRPLLNMSQIERENTHQYDNNKNINSNQQKQRIIMNL